MLASWAPHTTLALCTWSWQYNCLVVIIFGPVTIKLSYTVTYMAFWCIRSRLPRTKFTQIFSNWTDTTAAFKRPVLLSHSNKEIYSWCIHYSLHAFAINLLPLCPTYGGPYCSASLTWSQQHYMYSYDIWVCTLYMSGVAKARSLGYYNSSLLEQQPCSLTQSSAVARLLA